MVSHKLRNIKREFPKTLKDCMGIISTACNKVGIERKTYYNWRENDLKFAMLCDEAIEHTGDFVESKLLKRISEDDTTAIIFYCKTKLKKRGYVERIEQTGKDGAPIQSETKVELTDEQITERWYKRRLEMESRKIL